MMQASRSEAFASTAWALWWEVLNEDDTKPIDLETNNGLIDTYTEYLIEQLCNPVKINRMWWAVVRQTCTYYACIGINDKEFACVILEKTYTKSDQLRAHDRIWELMPGLRDSHSSECLNEMTEQYTLDWLAYQIIASADVYLACLEAIQRHAVNQGSMYLPATKASKIKLGIPGCIERMSNLYRISVLGHCMCDTDESNGGNNAMRRLRRMSSFCNTKTAEVQRKNRKNSKHKRRHTNQGSPGTMSPRRGPVRNAKSINSSSELSNNTPRIARFGLSSDLCRVDCASDKPNWMNERMPIYAHEAKDFVKDCLQYIRERPLDHGVDTFLKEYTMKRKEAIGNSKERAKQINELIEKKNTNLPYYIKLEVKRVCEDSGDYASVLDKERSKFLDAYRKRAQDKTQIENMARTWGPEKDKYLVMYLEGNRIREALSLKKSNIISKKANNYVQHANADEPVKVISSVETILFDSSSNLLEKMIS